ncbi:hypothetical protein GCM10010978_29840 [Compostibacillus humi]|uniref:Uncharacterized protein n=1 Tax=Compostibacillus humi TaxID=1245525 RepID=A0A8J2XGF9_9BACI|nr:hypothetical protein GCM10010978_29840 [Compostibacillus humi]
MNMRAMGTMTIVNMVFMNITIIKNITIKAVMKNRVIITTTTMLTIIPMDKRDINNIATTILTVDMAVIMNI